MKRTAISLTLLIGCSGQASSPTPTPSTTSNASAVPSPQSARTGDESPPTHAAITSPARWLGAKACAECHPAESQAWSGSDHERAMAPANEQTVLGDFNNATYRYAGVTTTFFRRDGAFMVRTDGPDGKLKEYPIAFTFGVAPLQQYLIPFPDGRYQSLSIAWDARPPGQGGQRWFHLYPDEKVTHGDVLHWTRLSQNWNYMCAECHSTNLQKNYNAAGNRYDTNWTDVNVACEACHGPGSHHDTWARSRAAQAEAGRKVTAAEKGLLVALDPRAPELWVRPDGDVTARRTRPLATHSELDTCARCHARRTSFTDQPGKPLLEIARPALLDSDLYHADGQIQGEVYEWGSFVQSKMYHAGVRCTDCHDPHTLKLRNEGNGTCTTCHLAEHFEAASHHHHPGTGPGTGCVDCHMPQTTYMVVDPRRDHSLRVPRPDLSVALGTPNACNLCHQNKTASWAAEATSRWYKSRHTDAPHWGEAIDAGRRGLPGAEALLTALAMDSSMPAIARATAVNLIGRPGSAAGVAAIQHALTDREPLLRWAAVVAHESLPPDSRVKALTPLVTDPVRLVRMETARLLDAVASAPLPDATRGQRELAMREYLDAQNANSDHPSSRLNLAVLHTDRGEFAQAERQYKAALEIEPLLAVIYVNLADLYRGAGRETDAERTLLDGIARVPDDAALHHSLGLLLIRRGHAAQALPELERASRLAPDIAHYAYVHGVALESAGNDKAALAVLDNALSRHPTDAQLLVALITFNRDRGAVAAALGYARRLLAARPGDATAQQLVAELTAAQ